MEREELFKIPNGLAFNWWWGPGDPIPDPFLKDPFVVRELAATYLELQAKVFEARAVTARKAIEIVNKQR